MVAREGPELPVEGKTVRALTSALAKRTHHSFSQGVINPYDDDNILEERCDRVNVTEDSE
jgi:hypothetical protein